MATHCCPNRYICLNTNTYLLLPCICAHTIAIKCVYLSRNNGRGRISFGIRSKFVRRTRTFLISHSVRYYSTSGPHYLLQIYRFIVWYYNITYQTYTTTLPSSRKRFPKVGGGEGGRDSEIRKRF